MVVSMHTGHVVRTCDVQRYVWDSTPSCVPVVVLFTGNCLFVLPLSLVSLLLLRTHRLTGMYPSLLLCLSLRGNVSQCNGVPVACYDSSTCSDDSSISRCNGVLVAFYDSSTHADDRHLHCWVMYACFHTDVLLGLYN